MAYYGNYASYPNIRDIKRFLESKNALTFESAISIDNADYKSYAVACATYSPYIVLTPEGKFFFEKDKHKKHWIIAGSIVAICFLLLIIPLLLFGGLFSLAIFL